MEYKAAYDSGVVVIAKRGGTVTAVDADTIEIKGEAVSDIRTNLLSLQVQTKAVVLTRDLSFMQAKELKKRHNCRWSCNLITAKLHLVRMHSYRIYDLGRL